MNFVHGRFATHVDGPIEFVVELVLDVAENQRSLPYSTFAQEDDLGIFEFGQHEKLSSKAPLNESHLSAQSKYICQIL